jgi:hypothetical protein
MIVRRAQRYVRPKPALKHSNKDKEESREVLLEKAKALLGDNKFHILFEISGKLMA